MLIHPYSLGDLHISAHYSISNNINRQQNSQDSLYC
nr:MAG TPA: hypothetical protein [Caudoviricetes sp.]